MSVLHLERDQLRGLGFLPVGVVAFRLPVYPVSIATGSGLNRVMDEGLERLGLLSELGSNVQAQGSAHLLCSVFCILC